MMLPKPGSSDKHILYGIWLVLLYIAVLCTAAVILTLIQRGGHF